MQAGCLEKSKGRLWRAAHGCRPRAGASVNEFDLAEVAVLFFVRSGREEESVLVAGISTVAEADSPEPVDRERVGAFAEATRVMPLARRVVTEGVDFSVSEVAHDQTPAEPAEIIGRHRHAPRRVERAVRADSRDQVPVAVELADEAIADARDVVLSALLRVGHENRASDRLDAERAETGGNAVVLEASGCGDLVQGMVVEVPDEGFDFALRKVGRVQD